MKNTAATSRPPRFDKQWSESIAANLSAAEAGLLTEAIIRYQLDGTLPELPPMLMVAFEFLRPTIDRRARAREKARERRLRKQSAQVEPAKIAKIATIATVANLAAPEPPAPAIKLPDVTPGEEDWAARFRFWKDLEASHKSMWTQEEIDNNRPSFETEVWEHELDDRVPDHPDGTPMSYEELLRHYSLIMRHDPKMLLHISDEVARHGKVLYRSSDLCDHIELFINHSTDYIIINLNRTTFRRAFIRYMLRSASNYRSTWLGRNYHAG